MMRRSRRVARGSLVLVAAIGLTGTASVGRYTVRPGDTLSALATRFHVTVRALANANGIANVNRIFVGRSLDLPPQPRQTGAAATRATTTLVVALPGDTLITLASRAGAAPSAFAAANGIVSGMVYAGARYRVPPSSSGSAVPFVANPPRAVTSGRHDTVMAIARRTHTSARDIASLNGLTLSGALRPGTRVLIPSSWRCPVQRATFMNDWGFGREGGAPHQGNDLMAARGTPVVAPVDGVVVRHPNHLGGNAVWLYGSDGNSYYGAHLERYGAQGAVRRGTIIGYVGDTGDARGGPTHLHFEIHPGRGPAVNPYPTLVSACR